MARIVYSMSGEGRGHATRVEAVVSMLTPQHDVLVYAPPLAHHLLSESFQGHDRVELRRLQGLQFQYSGSRLSYVKSVLGSFPFLATMGSCVAAMEREISDWGASHAICDFEPLLARAAARRHIPLISLDHQHFLTTIETKSLPQLLKWKVRALAPSVNLFCPRPVQQIVSAYFDFPVRRDSIGVDRVGALMRDRVLNAKSEWGDHLVAYFRRHLPEPVLQSLAVSGRRVHVYGLGAKSRMGNVRFHSTSIGPFLEHLRTCRALVTSAGNQLVGEALFLRKPVLAIPEPGNFEQSLNAHFLPKTGGGQVVSVRRCTARLMGEFLDRGIQMRDVICTDSIAGNCATRRLLSRIFDPQTAAEKTTVEKPTQEIAA